MFYPFTIKADTIKQLQLETGTYASAGEAPDKYTGKPSYGNTLPQPMS